EFYPVGSTQLIHVDVRLIACTNRDLEEMVKQKLFREDLYFRLNVYTIEMSPLRDRPEDIRVLAEYFLERFNRKFGKDFKSFTPRAYQRLLSHPWKGNVRELRNVIERAILSIDGEVLDEDHLFGNHKFLSADNSGKTMVLPESGVDLEEVEKQ